MKKISIYLMLDMVLYVQQILDLQFTKLLSYRSLHTSVDERFPKEIFHFCIFFPLTSVKD